MREQERRLLQDDTHRCGPVAGILQEIESLLDLSG